VSAYEKTGTHYYFNFKLMIKTKRPLSAIVLASFLLIQLATPFVTIADTEPVTQTVPTAATAPTTGTTSTTATEASPTTATSAEITAATVTDTSTPASDPSVAPTSTTNISETSNTLSADTSAQTDNRTHDSASAAVSDATNLATDTTHTTTATASTVTVPVLENPTTTIVTGTAIALANILNMVNTNIVNSSGTIFFSNLYDPAVGVIDLRKHDASCTSTPCASGDNVLIHLADNADISNLIRVLSNSGDNTIDTATSGTIKSGNSYAGLNLINLANTNIVDSNYLLLALNAFQGIKGDIVFPSLTNFFAKLGGKLSLSSTDKNTTKTTAAIDSNSGNNTTSGASESLITSGDAHSSTNVFNELNSLLGGANVSILFKVHGVWNGSIFGAPDTIGTITGADGSTYIYDKAHLPLLGAGQSVGDTGITSASTSTITNDVGVSANSGNNAIKHSGTDLITTGDAYAGANIVNVANTNVVGRNWILAVMNIFGDFNGNISFGRPDLWVGEKIENTANTLKGSIVKYRYSLLNNGDSPATQIKLSDAYDAGHMEIVDSSVPYTTSDGKLVFDLGSLPAGMGTEVSYTARITRTDDTQNVTNTVTVSERETDNNTADNTDTATLRTGTIVGGPTTSSTYIPSGGHGFTANSENSVADTSTQNKDVTLSVKRTNETAVLSPIERSVTETLNITNTGNAEAAGIQLSDVLTDPSGVVVHTEPWDIGTIAPGEEVTVSYVFNFNDAAQPGNYTLSSSISGTDLTDTTFAANGAIVLAEQLKALPAVSIEDITSNTMAPTTIYSSLAAPATAPNKNVHPVVRSLPASPTVPKVNATVNPATNGPVPVYNPYVASVRGSGVATSPKIVAGAVVLVAALILIAYAGRGKQRGIRE
jgi:hypothetical protein